MAPEHPPPAVVSSQLQTDIFLNNFLTATSEKVSERCPAPYICVCVCIYIPTHRNQDRHLVHTCVCIYIYVYTNINQKSSQNTPRVPPWQGFCSLFFSVQSFPHSSHGAVGPCHAELHSGLDGRVMRDSRQNPSGRKNQMNRQLFISPGKILCTLFRRQRQISRLGVMVVFEIIASLRVLLSFLFFLLYFFFFSFFLFCPCSSFPLASFPLFHVITEALLVCSAGAEQGSWLHLPFS